MLVKLDADLSVAFGTRIFLRKKFLDSAVNAGLENAVRARAEAQPGVRVSNAGGWQSQPDLFDWREPEVQMLGVELDRAVRQYATFGRGKDDRGWSPYKAGWANINRAGHYNIMHNHPGQDLAAVYYVKAGTPNTSGGELELRDPRSAAGFSRHTGLFSADPLRITPETGMLVIFPAWLDHMVHPHNEQHDRISLAINITLKDFKD